MKVIKLAAKSNDNSMWPIDCIMKNIDDYEEILIIAKKKKSDSYTRFSTGLRSTFWWIGCLQAVIQMIMEESLTIEDD